MNNENKPFYIINSIEELILWLMFVSYVIGISSVLYYNIIVKDELVKTTREQVFKEIKEENIKREKEKLKEIANQTKKELDEKDLYKNRNLDLSMLYKFNKYFDSVKMPKQKSDYDKFKELELYKKWKLEINADKDFLVLSYKNLNDIDTLINNNVKIQDIKKYTRLINIEIEKLVLKLNPRDKLTLDEKVKIFNKDYEILLERFNNLNPLKNNQIENIQKDIKIDNFHKEIVSNQKK